MTAAATILPAPCDAPRSGSLSALAALLFLGIPVIAAHAQVQDSLVEIIVTAQKREQNLQDVGTSIAALTSEQIQQLGLTDTDVHRAANTGRRDVPVLAGRHQYRDSWSIPNVICGST